MNDNEKKVQNQGQEPNPAGPCCGPAQWTTCGPDTGTTASDRFSGADMSRVMTRCFSGCRYFLLIAAIVGIVLVILGYYLAPEVLRAFWMIAAAMMAAMALFGVYVMRRMAAGHNCAGCCGPRPGRDL